MSLRPDATRGQTMKLVRHSLLASTAVTSAVDAAVTPGDAEVTAAPETGDGPHASIMDHAVNPMSGMAIAVMVRTMIATMVAPCRAATVSIWSPAAVEDRSW